MNRLIVGANKSDILRQLPDDFLLIDDGPIIEQLSTDPRPKNFDVSKHAFNPIKDIDYRKACDLISVLDAVFPEGETTLTRRYSNLILLEALLTPSKHRKQKPLHQLLSDSKDPYEKDAYGRIRRLYLSPVLNRVLDHSAPPFPMEGRIIAQLDRALLGDFDAFVIANFLVSRYSGTVIIPDFGFYGCKFHTSLIRQERLIAGVNFLDESPLKDQLLLIEDKTGSRCTAKDAEVLAQSAGLVPDFTREDNPYNRFIHARVA